MTEIELCIDCVMLVANGECFDADGNDISDAHADAIAAVWGDTRLIVGDGEEFFAWSRCDGCHSSLGGTRLDGYADAE